MLTFRSTDEARRTARIRTNRGAALALTLAAVSLATPAPAHAQPVVCGDGTCDASEDPTSCPTDCAPSGFAQCPADLPACTASLATCCRRPFDPIGQNRAILIPMDRCHQKVANGGPQSPPGLGSPEWCSEMGTSQDDGMIEAYGLVYRLMQRGIPVYWLINPSKAPQGRGGYTARDIDLWMMSPDATQPPDPTAALTPCPSLFCAAAAYRLDPSDLTVPVARYDYQQMPIRGSAFLIAPEDRVAFNDFWANTVAPAPRRSAYDFSSVDLYELPPGAWLAYQEFHRPAGAAWQVVTGAPVALRIDYAPPRIAKLSGGPSDNWLAAAKLDQPASNTNCLSAPFSPSDAVYCDISASEIASGLLNTADVTWAWVDQGGFSCAEITQFERFMAADGGVPGKSMLIMEGAITDAEACAGQEIMGAAGGLATRSAAVGGPYIHRYPANQLAQWGDIEADFAQGSVSGWYVTSYGSAGYAPGSSVVRLVTKDWGSDCADNASTPACDTASDLIDVLAYARYDDAPQNGLAVYAPGNNITQAGNRAHLRAVLNALIAMPTSGGKMLISPPAAVAEVSRATPIVANLDGGTTALIQGSFDYEQPLPPRPIYTGASDDATFEFPYTRGHFRAVSTADIGETATDFDELTPLFDLAAPGTIPLPNPAGCGASAFSASCRTVFTHVDSGALPARVTFDRSNSAALEPLLEGSVDLTTDEIDTLIGRVLAGVPDGGGGYTPGMGGVDRSTPAVIGASPLAGTDRPTMAYVGALDGMLHAVCAEVTGACSYLGQELWAFIPRTQLPRLRENSQRIDGSPRVTDAFGDFDGDGDNEWKTVLVITTGSGDPSEPSQAPAVVAIDISNPADPSILWEVTTSGPALGSAIGPVRVGGINKPLAFVSTNRGDSAPGISVVAIDIITGGVEWSFDNIYPTPRDTATPPVPQSGLPAAPSAIDLDGVGQLTHVVVPTLYGSVWVLEADDGASAYGNKPLFSFSTDFHPIGASASIYRDAASQLHAVIGSGGYVDPLGITSWAPETANQFVVSVSLTTPLAQAPVDETANPEFVPFIDDLGPGIRVFAAPTVAGGELFVVTDSADLNDLATYGVLGDTGSLRRYGLATGALKGSPIGLASGGSSVDLVGSDAFAAVGTGAQKIDLSADFDDVGRRAELDRGDTFRRLLWLRTQ